MRSKKAQGWGIDLMIGSVIFSIGIIVFYLYAMNGPDEGKEIVNNLFYDGKIIAGTVLSDGFPTDWDQSNVIKIGILSDHRINETKLERFYDYVQSNYNESKIKFNTKYDYYFFLDENFTINGNQVEGIGRPKFDRRNITSKNLVKITRFTIYKNKPITGYVYIWED